MEIIGADGVHVGTVGGSSSLRMMPGEGTRTTTPASRMIWSPAARYGRGGGEPDDGGQLAAPFRAP